MKLWKIVRWVFLTVLVLVLILLLTKPPSPATDIGAARKKQLASQFEQKLGTLEEARATGQSGAAESFSSDEVNAGLQAMIEAGQQGTGPADAAQVHNVNVAFEGDEVTGQASVERLGKDIYVTVRGRLGARDGYVTFDPTEFKIGNLTIPVSMVNPRLQERLKDPDVRERLKLPDFIADLRVRDGQLEITQK